MRIFFSQKLRNNSTSWKHFNLIDIFNNKKALAMRKQICTANADSRSIMILLEIWFLMVSVSCISDFYWKIALNTSDTERIFLVQKPSTSPFSPFRHLFKKGSCPCKLMESPFDHFSKKFKYELGFKSPRINMFFLDYMFSVHVHIHFFKYIDLFFSSKVFSLQFRIFTERVLFNCDEIFLTYAINAHAMLLFSRMGIQNLIKVVFLLLINPKRN